MKMKKHEKEGKVLRENSIRDSSENPSRGAAAGRNVPRGETAALQEPHFREGNAGWILTLSGG